MNFGWFLRIVGRLNYWRMKMIENEAEVKGFLQKHPKVKIVTATTIYSGFVSCIGPVPTICGPELICNPGTLTDLMKIVNRC